MTKQRFKFRKSEKLCNKKLISQLFENQCTEKITEYPYLFIWKNFEDSSRFPAQILISVSKKKFKRAVDRNKIKRQIREVYRMKKDRIYEILDNKNIKLIILLIFVGEEKFQFQILLEKFDALINRFEKTIQ